MFSRLFTVEGKEIFVNLSKVISITRVEDHVVNGVKTPATQLRMGYSPDVFIYVKDAPRDIRKAYFDRGEYIW